MVKSACSWRARKDQQGQKRTNDGERGGGGISFRRSSAQASPPFWNPIKDQEIKQEHPIKIGLRGYDRGSS